MPKKVDHSLRRRLIWQILALSRPSKRMIMVVSDLIVIPLALWCALVLKYEQLLPAVRNLPLLMAVAGLSAIPVFVRLGLYRAVVRYFGLNALFAVLGGVTISTLLLAFIDRFLGGHQLTAATLAIYWSLATLYAGGTRMLMRYAFHRYTGQHAERIAIYGAGQAGAQLAAALSGGQDMWPVAFIDDKRSLQRSVIRGIEVFAPDRLEELVRDRDITGVLLAIPTASRRRKREILTQLEPLGLHVRSIPDIGGNPGGPCPHRRNPRSRRR